MVAVITVEVSVVILRHSWRRTLNEPPKWRVAGKEVEESSGGETVAMKRKREAELEVK